MCLKDPVSDVAILVIEATEAPQGASDSLLQLEPNDQVEDTTIEATLTLSTFAANSNPSADMGVNHNTVQHTVAPGYFSSRSVNEPSSSPRLRRRKVGEELPGRKLVVALTDDDSHRSSTASMDENELTDGDMERDENEV